MELLFVFRAVVIAYDRTRAHAVADKNRHEDHAHVHENAVGRHAVFARVAHELGVVEHADKAHGNVAHELRRAVGAGSGKCPSVKAEAREDEKTAAALLREIDERNHAADKLAERRRERRARKSPAERTYKQRVERHIAHAGGHGHIETQLRLLRRGKQALEVILQQIKRRGQQNDPSVEHAVSEHFALRAEKPCNCGQKRNAERAENEAQHGRADGQHRENAVRFFGQLFAELFCNQRAAAGSEHEARTAEDHQDRHDEVDGGKGRFACEVRDEEAVYHAVDRCEGHHDDRRRGEAQQPPDGKMIG